MIPLPANFRLELDPSVRTYRNGELLVGGSPRRVIRLTPAGRAALQELTDGRGGSPAARQLGRRLVDGWLARPVPAGATPLSLTVVIPVRDRPGELDRCLATLGSADPIIVVDDGSADPAAIATVCKRHGARLLARERSGGPAAARNSALPAVATECVAFLDSDCIPSPGWARALAAHLADPSVGAVAPRVRPLPTTPRASVRARFAAARSALDMGPRGGEVGPGKPVAYVPTAALIVRRSALGRGFDEALRYGEDVDLVWRLNDAGWRVRYAPSVCVHHKEPGSWAALFGRRFRYGCSAAALASRHPGRLPGAVLTAGPAVSAGLLLTRRRRLGAAAAAVIALRLSLSLRTAGAPPMLGPYAAGESVGRTVLELGRASTMLAPPLLIAALRRPRTRTAALTLLLARPIAESRRLRPRLDPIRFTAAAIADDVVYGAGVWFGCLRARTLAPLVPSIRLR